MRRIHPFVYGHVVGAFVVGAGSGATLDLKAVLVFSSLRIERGAGRNAHDQRGDDMAVDEGMDTPHQLLERHDTTTRR